MTLTPTVATGANAGVGRPYMLVCQAEKRSDGTVVGSVRPEQVPSDEPLAGCDGAISIVLFQMDVIHGLTVSEIHPDAVTTACGAPGGFLDRCAGLSRFPLIPGCHDNLLYLSQPERVWAGDLGLPRAISPQIRTDDPY